MEENQQSPSREDAGDQTRSKPLGMASASAAPGSLPLRFFWIGLAATAVVLPWVCWSSYSSYRRDEQEQGIALRIKELKGQIIHMDEVLTMSARMAAATGDVKWEKRYHEFEPKLDAAIKDSVTLAPPRRDEHGATETDAANAALLEMEGKAFSLAREGKLADAQNLLASPSYEENKAKYAEGMQELDESLEESLIKAQQAEDVRMNLRILGVVVVMLLLGLVWAAVYRHIRSWQTALVHANRRLTEQTDELVRLNSGLDKIVAERTNELKQSLSKLQESEAQMQAIVEGATDGIITSDECGIVHLYNQAASHIFGFSKEDILGHDVSILIPPPQAEHYDSIFARSLPTGETRVVGVYRELEGKRKDGSTFPMSLGVSEVLLKDRKLFTGIVRDLTEQKRLQSQMLSSQKLESIGQLAAGIAHEINTPTQFIGDNTRFLRDAFQNVCKLVQTYGQLMSASEGSENRRELLTKVQRVNGEADIEYLLEEIPRAIDQSLDGIERVSRIVQSMRDFSHPDAEEKTPMDVNRAIENTMMISRNEWKYVANTVLELDPELPLVPAFPGGLNQVLLNLIVNAADAIREKAGSEMEQKGEIKIATRRDGDWVEIRVSDTGIGISEAARPHIFDPFFTTKEIGKGTGQGLSIAHTVVTRQHGGTILFETECGGGTTFIVRLPAEAAVPLEAASV